MSTETKRSQPGGPIDCDELLSRCMGRIELMELMLSSFRNNAQCDIDALLAAMEAGSNEEIARLAHKLKGTCLTVSARSLARTADRLHQLAVQDDGPTFCDFSSELSKEYQSIVKHLDDLATRDAP